VVAEKSIGVLNIESKEANRFEHDLWFLSSLAARFMAIDRGRVYDKLANKHCAIRSQTLQPLLLLTISSPRGSDFLMRGIPMSLIFIDINGLKKLMTQRHNSGDMVLLEVAEFLRYIFPKTMYCVTAR
jgi:hypothetical protein